jgi:hypothetical protein
MQIMARARVIVPVNARGVRLRQVAALQRSRSDVLHASPCAAIPALAAAIPPQAPSPCALQQSLPHFTVF